MVRSLPGGGCRHLFEFHGKPIQTDNPEIKFALLPNLVLPEFHGALLSAKTNGLIGLEFGVAAVTERFFAAVLASAEVNRAVFVGGVRLRREPAALVGPVTERLGFALSAGTPVVGFSCFDGYGIGSFLRDAGFFHMSGW